MSRSHCYRDLLCFVHERSFWVDVCRGLLILVDMFCAFRFALLVEEFTVMVVCVLLVVVFTLLMERASMSQLLYCVLHFSSTSGLE